MKFWGFWISIPIAFCAAAQPSPKIRLTDTASAVEMRERDGDVLRFDKGIDYSPKAEEVVVDMLEYMIPPQSVDSERQFYLEGYMECFGVPGSTCALGGMARHVRGGFQKQIMAKPDKSGNIRFSSSKDRFGLLGHPCEYHETRNEHDGHGQLITILYLRSETMDWVGNKKYRTYYDGLGNPLLEWGRSRAVVGRAYVQDPGFEIDNNCDNTIETYPIPPANYVARVYSLEGDLEEVNRRLGDIGPVEPKWVGMAHEMGQKAELLVVEDYWGWTKNSPGLDPWRWYNREIYMYLMGVGWVSWRWQEHEAGDLQEPFVTHQLGNMDMIVWEKPGEFIRNVELCEPLSTSGQPSSGSELLVRGRRP